MAEKIKCEHCYKKYNPARFKTCPLCGLAQTRQEDIEDFTNANTELEPEFDYEGELEDLREDISRARSSAKQAGAGLFVALLGMGAGLFLVFNGYANQLRCLVQSSACSGADSSGIGIAVIGISFVIALILSITAMLS